MAKIHIKTDQTTQYDISTSDNHIVLEKGVGIVSPDSGISELAGLTGNEIEIRGTVTSQGMLGAALALKGQGTDADIAGTGRLKGDIGVMISGNDVKVVNHGRINGEVYGIGVTGNNAHIVNHGEIIANTSGAFFTNAITALQLDNDGLIRSRNGFEFQVQSLEINLGKDSIIELGSTGVIHTNSVAGWTATIRNEGSITHDKVGMSSAIEGGAGEEIVRNSGTMTGFVNLDAGNDVYDGRGGRIIKGAVFGGEGDDTYYLSNSRDRVHDSAGWGYDKLTVSASYKLGANNEIEETRLAGKGDFNLKGNELGNYLVGNRGDNRLSGLAGDDAFFGGAGDDVMSGGAGSDAFYFKPNADREIVTDFTDGEDLLVYFSTSLSDTVDALLADHVHQRGDDLVISNHGTEMILRNVDKADLTAADFIS